MKTQEQPDWNHGLKQVFKFLQDNIMARSDKGCHFVMDNWTCKYINLRVDMRTGNVSLFEGNTDKPKFISLNGDKE